MGFNIGTDYDLYSVMLHETGLALGLAEVTNPAEVMDGITAASVPGSAAGDIAGIQALYGPRTPTSSSSRARGSGLERHRRDVAL